MEFDDEVDTGTYVFDDFVVKDAEDPVETCSASTSLLVDVDPANIVTGKRRRCAPKTIYEEKEFSRAIASTMLADVPADEIAAAVEEDCDDACIDSDEETATDSFKLSCDKDMSVAAPAVSGAGTRKGRQSDEEVDEEFVLSDNESDADVDVTESEDEGSDD